MQLPFSSGPFRIFLPLWSLPLLLTASCAGDGGGGVSISDYIRADRYTAMVFEVDRVPEVIPRAASVANLVATAESVLDKPDGITAVDDDVLASAGADPSWTTGELRALADASRDLVVDDGTVVMQLLYVNGRWSESNSVIGLQIRRNTVVIFAERIDSACQGTFPLIQAQLCRGLESTVLAHEFGHAIGLVNNGLPMVDDHEDPDHRAHDPDSNCLMYWAAEGSDVASALGNQITGGGPEALEFCPASLADIAALRD